MYDEEKHGGSQDFEKQGSKFHFLFSSLWFAPYINNIEPVSNGVVDVPWIEHVL